jgi:hypothetical protein
MTTREAALVELLARLRAEFEPDLPVDRNVTIDETVPAPGLIVLRDGDPGEPLMAIGAATPWYHWEHVAEAEVMVADQNDAARSSRLDQVMERIDAVVRADPTLGGLIAAARVMAPEILHERVPGAVPHAYARLPIVLQFATSSGVG